MKISRRAFALSVPMTAVCARRLSAAGVDGKWEAEIQSPRGATVVVFDLKSDGEALTGQLGNDMMGMSDIQDGKVSGDSVSFVQVTARGDFQMRFQYEGKVSGDEMELTRTMVRPAGGGPGRRPGGGARQGGGPRPRGGQGGGQRPGGARGGMGGPMTFTAKRVQ